MIQAYFAATPSQNTLWFFEDFMFQFGLAESLAKPMILRLQLLDRGVLAAAANE